MSKLRIAIYCTNEFSCPLPKEIIYAPMDLAEILVRELSKRGHDVTFYCSSDSGIEAKKISNDMVSFYKLKDKPMNGGFHDQLQLSVYEQLLASKMYEDAGSGKYDIIHAFHLVPKLLPFVNQTKTPTVFTLHDPMDSAWNNAIGYCAWRNRAYYVSISDNQRKGMPDLNYVRTVYNGLDLGRFKFRGDHEGYLAYLGRYTYEKGVDAAVNVATRSKEKLKIAGSAWGNGFYAEKVKPYIKQGEIEDLGFLDRSRLSDFLGGAKAFLFPVRWQEPFGLVMIEAMACGTPVIAFGNGSVPEVVEHGKTGFIVENEEGMIEAIKNIGKIKRSDCRKRVRENFNIEKMVDGYEEVYRKIICGK
ncbi:MAG: glycosyltransferase family 4 protein [Candidatus Paceibacterota bacterium]|jgi:glycosyltransferase involved in cell wall biosynthesis